MKKTIQFFIFLLFSFIPILVKANDDLVRIGDKKYSSFEAAINELQDNDTLELLGNSTYSVKDQNFYLAQVGVNAKINLNGFTLDFIDGSLAGQVLNVAGNLEIYGSGTITMTLGNGFTIHEGGTLTLNDVSIKNSKAFVFSTDNMFNVNNNGTLIIKNGTFTSISFVVNNLGNVTIHDGIFNTGLTTSTLNGDNITILGGTFKKADGIDDISSRLKDGYYQDENGTVISPNQKITYEWENPPNQAILPNDNIINNDDSIIELDKTFYKGYKIFEFGDDGKIIGYYEFSGWEVNENKEETIESKNIIATGTWTYEEISVNTKWNYDDDYHWITDDVKEFHIDLNKDEICDVCHHSKTENPNTAGNSIINTSLVCSILLVTLCITLYVLRKKRIINQY